MNPTADELINKILLIHEPNSAGNKRHYRFSDVIKHLGHYWKESTEFILNQHHLTNTILRKYIECCPDKNMNQVNPNRLQLLHDIIQTKIANEHYNLPADDELVIHLRIGDMVVFDSFLQKDYVEIIQKYMDTHNITKVTFCTAFHYGNNTTQGLWLYTDEKHNKNINKLTELFTTVLEHFTHLQIDVKSSANIDDDVIYMVMSKHFVADHGGFSNLIQNLINFSKKLKM